MANGVLQVQAQGRGDPFPDCQCFTCLRRRERRAVFWTPAAIERHRLFEIAYLSQLVRGRRKMATGSKQLSHRTADITPR